MQQVVEHIAITIVLTAMPCHLQRQTVQLLLVAQAHMHFRISGDLIMAAENVAQQCRIGTHMATEQ